MNHNHATTIRLAEEIFLQSQLTLDIERAVWVVGNKLHSAPKVYVYDKINFYGQFFVIHF